MSANASIEIQPLISYPRTAAVGKSYVMTVDLRQASLEAQWPYEVEEYTIHLMLDSQPLFASEPIGDASVVLHRFGGTYGPATFLLTASQEEMQGNMRLTLVNDSGMPVDVIEIPGIRVTAEGEREATREVVVTKGTVVTSGGVEVVTRTYDRESEPTGKAPPGFRLRHFFRVLSGYPVGRITWSPDGKILAVPTNKVQLCDAEAGRLLSALLPPSWDDRLVTRVAFSPDGNLLAIDPGDYSLEVWDPKTSSRLRRFKDKGQISSFAWSPDSNLLASCTTESRIVLWDVQSGESVFIWESKDALITSVAWFPDGDRFAVGVDDEIHIWSLQYEEVLMVFEGHSGIVYKVALSPDGNLMASTGDDQTIQLRDSNTGSVLRILEDNSSNVVSLSFSADGRLFVSDSTDGIVKVWSCETGARVAQLDGDSVGAWVSSPAFSPTQSALAVVEKHSTVRIWDLDLDVLLAPPALEPGTPTTYTYSTAKVVLLGDSATGKSVLANRLVADAFTPTTATHGLQTWLWKTETETTDEGTETREILLWDLAGQSNYRLLHPLHVADASVALILFDARHQSDPFGSVRFWDSVLRQALADSRVVTKKILVATKVDTAGVPNRGSIDSLMHDLGFDAYFEVSAKEGTGIAELTQSIEEMIDWDRLVRTTTPILVKRLRDFVMGERDWGEVLLEADVIYKAFLSSIPQSDLDLMLSSLGITDRSQLQPHFDASIKTLENHGLLRRLGEYILLRIELIDRYASSIINAARSDPNGLGAINEDDLLKSHFWMPSDERVKNSLQEKILIESAIDSLVRHEIALRIGSQQESMLVFPSQITADNPELYEGRDAAARFQFQGMVEIIWARLCVRFAKNQDSLGSIHMARNVITCQPTDDTDWAVVLREFDDGRGELTLSYRTQGGRPAQSDLARFVHAQLVDLAIPNSIRRHDSMSCPNCHEELGFDFDSLYCPYCGYRVESQHLKIYVSSPFAGLQEYRQAVIEAVQKLGHETAFAEESNVVKSRSFEWMRETIAECDVYICILAWYRGYVPDLKDGKSVVQIEYETARELKKPVLVFLRDPMTDPGQYESSRELEDFRQQLLKEEHCAYFTTPTDLAEQVAVALARFSTPEGDPSENESSSQ